ncbi:cytochrome c [Defluviimonas sp. WL0050]|uniref:Cytochrome c n=1 Tax=Albidovulum litorale TaxID=2984134 RepID=A0ABT2ZQM8_9RHOB|nr:cytochrome c [Defluviimonas sp. WL0050]MCV2873465.1 cytochrome c [Defluviimonas sp. WL0050]
MRPLALILCLMTYPAQAASDMTLGAEVYAGACAACHGEKAAGDGPMRDLITIPVPDLTRIAARNGGEFPWLKVVHIIDGRTGLRGHGGPMPLFGTVFAGDASVADARDGTPVITSERVLAVVDYLAAIQVEE